MRLGSAAATNAVASESYNTLSNWNAVQLELRRSGTWRLVVRYDNAHGFCHRDVIHVDGSQEKIPVFYGDANDTFTRAIRDLRTHWESHRACFDEENQHD